MNENILTIFTPIYNRAEYLERLYNSLVTQTCKNFEWIAVDDGSTDNSLEVLHNLRRGGGGFPLTIIHKENGGKHTAINTAVPEAKGEYFMILDSDDYLLPDAVENVHNWINAIKKEPDYKYFVGVSGLRTDGKKIIGGSGTGAEYIDAKDSERKKYNLMRDKAEVYKTAILKMFPFPEFDGEKYLNEGLVWSLISAAGYKLRWYPSALIVCNYLPGGLTDMVEKNEVKCFDGFTYETKINLGLNNLNLFDYLKAIGRYSVRAKAKGLTAKEAARKINVSAFTIFWTGKVWKMFDILRKIIKTRRQNKQ